VRPDPTRNIAQNGTISMLIEDWFDSHSEARAFRHHAKVDAQAMRMAYLALSGKIEPNWSTT